MTKEFKWHGKRVEKQINAAAERALDKVAILTTNTAKLSMAASSGGPKYPGAKRSASLKGKPPAVQTGHLRRSVTYIKPAPLTRHIGTNIKYGLWLEIGTSPFKITVKTAKVLAAGSKTKGYVFFGKSVQHPGIQPRPWLRPAFNRNKGKLPGFMKDAV